MKNVDLPQYYKIIDALCILELGWNSETDHTIFNEARDVVTNHGYKCRLQREIEIKQYQ